MGSTLADLLAANANGTLGQLLQTLRDQGVSRFHGGGIDVSFGADPAHADDAPVDKVPERGWTTDELYGASNYQPRDAG